MTIEIYIGKETNKLEDAEIGLIHKLGQVLDVYADLRRGPWERLVRPVLNDIPAAWLEEKTGLSRRTIQRLRNGHSMPRPANRVALTAAAASFARWQLVRERLLCDDYGHSVPSSLSGPQRRPT